MRVRLVGRGTVNGLKNGSDIAILIVPEDSPERIDQIPIQVMIDPESDPRQPELWIEVPDA